MERQRGGAIGAGRIYRKIVMPLRPGTCQGDDEGLDAACGNVSQVARIADRGIGRRIGTLEGELTGLRTVEGQAATHRRRSGRCRIDD